LQQKKLELLGWGYGTNILFCMSSTPNGKVVFQEITTVPIEQRVQTGIAFVPQGNRVFTELTVRENLEIGGYLI
jgi:ABC-type branched-subunit amino acid transport system ATPase component